MRFINTQVHGVLDYAFAIICLALPYLFDAWIGQGAATFVAMGAGILVLAYSLCTDYEAGLFHLIPMRGHLAIDVALGALLALSPFVFGFAGAIWLPYVALGAFSVIAGLVTETRTRAQTETVNPLRGTPP